MRGDRGGRALRPARIALHPGLEDTAVWLARDAPKSVVARLMRATVGQMLERVVAEHDGQGADRLDGLGMIGIGEVAYRKGRRYLTC